MATNDFLVWAPGGGNVMSQGAYSTNTFLTNGVVTGLADNTLYNKSVRQSSIMAATIANFIIQELNLNVVDDGTTATILTNFTNALLKLTSTVTRIKLTANTTFYVSTTGNDSNDGLTPGTAFLTLQALVNYLYLKYDFGGYQVVIQLLDGTYTGAGFPSAFVGQIIPLILAGNSSTPANVQLVSSGSNSNTISCFNNASVIVSYMGLSSSGIGYGGYALNASGGGSINIGTGITFGACVSSHMIASLGGRILLANVGYSISAAAPFHYAAISGGQINIDGSQVGGITVTLAGGLNFSTAFATANSNGTVNTLGVTYSGSATGSKYTASLNGVINTFGGGGAGFPGSTAGTTFLGGQVS